jgi:hypothetical protein
MTTAGNPVLDVLLVEDSPEDMAAYLRDLPAVFLASGVTATLHKAESFEVADALVSDTSRRFDMILSDTYRGSHQNHDAAVTGMISKYRDARRFCPLVVFSASAMPEHFVQSAFVVWGDKTSVGRPGGVEAAITAVLATGIPQAARSLHDELDGLAGKYLWTFLEKEWEQLKTNGHVEPSTLGRMIRRRAAVQLGSVHASATGDEPLTEVQGHEVYLYPPINLHEYRLGEIIRKGEDFRVVLTPHCYMTIQQGKERPRSEYIVTIKTIAVGEVLCQKKVGTARTAEEGQKLKKIRTWITPPSHEDVGKPEGRYWYLPGFLEIPHSYCDFLQVESIKYDELVRDWQEVAVLSPPFAESLQACYGAFHGAVGIPNVMPASVASMIE